MRTAGFGLAALLATSVAAGPAVAACGTVEAPCAIDGGTYLVALPEAGQDAPRPAVIFLHGHGGSGAAEMGNTGVRDAVLARGYVFIAPDGQPMDGRNGRRWDFRGGGSRNDDLFLMAVAADAEARFGVDPQHILLAGFSAGGFEVSYFACRHPDAFSAFAPVAGGFWRPYPETCAGPVRLFHTHGWADTTVPLEGRPLGNAGARQGDIFHGMEMWREANGCTMMRPDETETDGIYLRRRWTSCVPGSALEFALHPGGHGVPPGWADMVLDWYEGLSDE